MSPVPRSTAAGTCAVLRLNLVGNVHDKKENEFFGLLHLSYAGHSGRAV